MFRTRPRGSLRAAALLAVGVSPLLAGAASAAAAPSLDGVNGNVGDAPELKSTVSDQTGKIASGKTVKLPAPAALPQAPQVPNTPQVPQAPDPSHALPVSEPAAPALPAAAEERALPAAPAVPSADHLPVNQLPVNQLDELPSLPVVGPLPSTGLPALG
ncbi:hypothetical protein [Umezawaea tangerina]|uniref:Uncharacterized protein n=1 Tax=Umezawaea tangerina TaxID=84725 RepID=A0A2T0T3S5_9PSEU|nr:hypothetical protein [Umezawaea tangerina]PRY40291.1 hypothetical protein CLV43_10625 [Umezawaea tangerina]